MEQSMQQPAGRGTPGTEHADAALVGRARQGDGDAFEAIMRRYNRRLFRVAYGILKDAGEAEDVIQDTYVRAFTRLDRFQGSAGFGAWLAKIAANEALQRRRRPDRLALLDDLAGPSGDETASGTGIMFAQGGFTPERLAAAGEMRRTLERLIEELPEAFRAVFMLRAVEQMSVAETAACLSIAPETVRSRFHRARAMLRKALDARIDILLPEVFPFDGERCDRIVVAVARRIHTRTGDKR